MVHLNALDQLRLQRRVERLHALGPRVTAEFLAQLGHRIGGMPAIFALLADYEQGLTPVMVRLARVDRFPPRPLHGVPRP